MKVNVLFFGHLTDIVSATFLQIENVKDTKTLREKLFSLYPSLCNIPFSMSVNKKFVHQNELLYEGDEVACLPPFSGG